MKFSLSVLNPFKSRQQGREKVNATYDAAETTRHNSKHWAKASDGSADAEMTPARRRLLRRRARYEVRNNSYAAGIISTRVNHVIGTEPHLQVKGNALGQGIEALFREWMFAVKLGEKLRLAAHQVAESGEAFIILSTNEKLPTPCKLWVDLVEPDRVSDPLLGGLQEKNYWDGITYDDLGNPIKYYVLNQSFTSSVQASYQTIPASQVIHLYRKTRPGQHRGVPDITPAIELFGQLRRYTLAVLDAAETAADISGVIESNSDELEVDQDVSALDSIELERRMAITLPAGWKFSQAKAEQPTSTYPEFKKQIIGEIARCLNMPLNIALADSSGYNYASGRLDHQTYFKDVMIDQNWIGNTVCTPIFRVWFDEMRLAEANFSAFETPEHEWRWDGTGHVDPTKEANAQETRLKNHTTTLAYEYALQGKDWETELRQRAVEIALVKELGLPENNTAPAARPGQNPPDDQNADDPKNKNGDDDE